MGKKRRRQQKAKRYAGTLHRSHVNGKRAVINVEALAAQCRRLERALGIRN